MVITKKQLASICKILIDAYPNKKFVLGHRFITAEDAFKKEKEGVAEYLGINTDKFGSIAFNLATNGYIKTAINIIKYHYKINSLYICKGKEIIMDKDYNYGYKPMRRYIEKHLCTS